jgi:5-methylthioadenosine/S-adenosylhomocysteine deaminase
VSIDAVTEQEPGKRLLLRGGTILSMDASVGNLQAGDLLIENGRIAAIAPSLESVEAKVIDARGMIVIPGFVDAHRHAWQGALKRLMPNVDNLKDYSTGTHSALAPHYRPQDMFVGNLLTALGCLDAGTTTIIDVSHNARTPAHTDGAIDGFIEAGVRALHCPGQPIAGEWQKHWPLDLERLQRERFSGADQLVTLGMTAQPNKEHWAVGRRLGLRMVTEFLGPMAGMLVELEREKLLGPDNIFNHCTTLPRESWAILRDTGVTITVDPRSDTQYALAGGVFAYQEAIDHGIRPGIGTDLETAYGGDMFVEMRVAFSLQRAIAQTRRYGGAADAPAPVRVQDLLAAATVDGARCAGLEARTGSLTPGKAADIVLIRTDDIGVYPSNNAFGTVVHAADRSNVDTVIVNGRIRKSGGKMWGVDMARIKRLTEESLSHLFNASGYSPDPFEVKFPRLLMNATG